MTAIGKIVVMCISLPLRLLGHLWTLLKFCWNGLSRLLRFSIAFKTMSVYTAMTGVVWLLFNVFVTLACACYLLFDAGAALERHARFIEAGLASDFISSDRVQLLGAYDDFEVVVFDMDGNIVMTTRQEARRKRAGVVVNLQPNLWLDERQMLNYQTTVAVDKDVYSLQVKQSLAGSMRYLVVLVGLIVVFSLMALLVIALAGYSAGGKMLRPIGGMTKTARLISANALDMRLDVGSSYDELKDLAETLNQMLDRLEQAYEQQNRFVSDASHELRTPLAVIQGYANLIKRWGHQDQAVLNESIDALVNEAERMKQLVEQLLFLARAEQDTQVIAREQFTLHTLVAEVVDETQLMETQHTVRYHPQQQVSVVGDRNLIKQALRIFVDNSVKYTPAGGTIQLGTWTEDQQAIVMVSDNGIGMAASETAHIFDRFYRCDGARSKTTGGTGLGLSIAKWIVEKHCGVISVNSAPHQGTRITVTLPHCSSQCDLV